MKLPTLFSKRENGGLQQWTIEVEHDGFRTIQGKQGGKLQVSEWTYCTGKNIGKSNATDGGSQALAEAEAKWEKKVALGERENPADLGNDGIFWPMLANDYKKKKDKVEFPLYCQPKMDGMRVVARKDGLWSRKGKRVLTMPHIEKALAPIFARYPGLVIDGEGYADKLKNDFHKILSLIKKTKPTPEDLEESAKMVEYHVYDCKMENPMLTPDKAEYRLNDPQAIFSDRSKFIRGILFGVSNKIILVDTLFVITQKDLDLIYEKYLSDDYEGQMVRRDAPYQNRRCDSLLKRKEFVDEEMTILDVTEGGGNGAGMAATMSFRNAGGEFKAGVMGNTELRKAYLRNKKEIIGMQATVKYTKLNAYGIPYFAKVKCVRDYQ